MFVVGNSYWQNWKILSDSYTWAHKAKEWKEIRIGNKYLYLEQLGVLDTTTKLTDDSIDQNEREENVKDYEIVDKVNTGQQEKPMGKTKMSPRWWIVIHSQEKYCEGERGLHKSDDNEDKLFLLSLCKDLSSVPDHMKLQVKSEILWVISSAKQICAFNWLTIVILNQHFKLS